MKNIIITGSPRSGSSAVAGCFRKSGYFMGDRLLKPSDFNPKGFFEDYDIIDLNEEILYKSYPKKFPFSGEWILNFKFKWHQRWLSRVPLSVFLYSDSSINDKINKFTKIKPFCYKDPRFSYTLPVWRSHLKNTVFICVFRHPYSSARSIITRYRAWEGIRELNLTLKDALEVWKLMYEHILKIHSKEGKWLFFNYDELFDEEKIKKLEKFIGARIDKNFPDKKLDRHNFKRKVPGDIEEIYKKLCDLSKNKI